LEDCSIGAWVDFHCAFLRYYGENKSFDQYLTKFNALRREEDEVFTQFKRRFYNFYLNMPKDIHAQWYAKFLAACKELAIPHGAYVRPSNFLLNLGKHCRRERSLSS
jgi:hypothetical protein